MPGISVKDVTIKYADKSKKDKKSKKEPSEIIALDNFSADFDDEKFNVIIGASGCGKTTLIRAVAGLLDYEGEIFFDETDAMELTVKDRNVAYVPQGYSLYPSMTVFDNIASPLKAAGAGREEVTERVKSIAKTLGLELLLNRKPKELSGGQQQLVAIGRALVRRPSVCLMDEPFSNVDVKKRAVLRSYVKNMVADTGCTVIYVTHDVKEAVVLADKLFIMNEGKLVASGTPIEVFKRRGPVIDDFRNALAERSLV